MAKLEEILNHRRAVRYFDDEKKLDTDRVRYCLELATLAPSSSNMQLWEFYHVTDQELLKRISHACLEQETTETAEEMVVFVTRRDLHRKRAKANLAFEIENIRRNSPLEKQERRLKKQTQYYTTVMPFIYSRFLGVWGLFRKLLASTISLFRPMVTTISECDMRTVVHKSCGLAAQTFMLAMAEQGYDTCPVEGFDNRRLKRLLRLPLGAEINMVVTCGVRKGDLGIRGDRFRIPFDEVYRHL